jgi:hypothetical protein
MQNTELTKSQLQRIRAGKAWFNMTSEGGVHFVPGNHPLYSDLFMFIDGHKARNRWKVVYRPGITPIKALSTIGDGHLHKSWASKTGVPSKMKAQASEIALREPVLFARIGWMKYYNGPISGDERPRGGGKYNKTGVGNEAFNFHEIDKQLFGYFQPQMQASKIKLERIVPGTHGDVLKGILVVFVATDPERGSQRIIGWYRSAIVHRNPQSSPPKIRNGFNYFLIAEAHEAVLLPTHLRSYLIPGGKGGFGQANICYLYEASGKPKPAKWASGALEFVQSYENENLLVNPQAEAAPGVVNSVEVEIERSAGFQSNSKIRKAVELHAMGRAEKEFQNRGYEVKDVSQTRPYDLLCHKSDDVKYVEVKGTQGSGLDIVLTAGEVKFIEQNKANCVLCVVHEIAVKGKGRPKATGGKVSMTEPFDLADGLLKPLAFTFRTKTSKAIQAVMLSDAVEV